MSHVTGTIQVLGAPLVIGPGSMVFNPPAAPGGTKLLMLHFQNASMLPGDQLRVQLGYDVDVFTAADGPTFWTRPVNVYLFPAGVQIDYISAGPATGSVQLFEYGRGERHAAVPDPAHSGFSNCDPFYQGIYVEPTYDPFWYCTNPPHWDNVACITPATDVRARVARSVGMIMTADTQGGTRGLSTCSVTLVDTDKVITAGHCHTPDEALTSSVTFDYQTMCDGTAPPGYNPKFYKVKAVLAHHWDGIGDFSLLQLAEAPVGIPVIQMRHDLPLAASGGMPGEQVFEVHHPNGAVKKLSVPQAEGLATVLTTSASGITVPTTVHVSGGSSGSGLFDAAGRIVGVLSNGDPCHGGHLIFFPIATVLTVIAPAPPPPVTRDVMVVFDRSGSMSSDDGTGRAKIDAARDAVSLFVQLVKAGTGNRAGLVSFSTTASSPVDFAITSVTGGTKTALIGPPPYAGGIVGALAPGGATTIGGGLESAQGQFPVAGPNPRAILLLTDGLENTAPMIADLEAAHKLDGITVHAIGLGSESNLNGSLLSALAGAHGGMYTRASSGVTLEKFFSSAFGNIFEAGILMDPEFDLAAGQLSGTALPFRVCGEETITAVAGWNSIDGILFLEMTTPNGVVITSTSAGVETATGRTWAFLRIPLPAFGERDGLWSVSVTRPGGGGEFPPPTPALHYFVNIIPSGGPRMTRFEDAPYYYTGDPINPVVLVRHDDGGWPDNMKATLTITRPDAGAGNLLSKTGLGLPATIDADVIPARQATLQAQDKAAGKPVIGYVDTTVDLLDDSTNTKGTFEATATFGRALPDMLTVEGNYTFNAKATYGDDCSGMRELVWSRHVEIGIDPGQTTVTTTLLDAGPDGGSCVRMTFTPRDKYGNLLGPGRLDGFSVAPLPGSSPSSPVTDRGDGSYQVDVCSDPGSLEPPSVGVVQPGRPPVPIRPLVFELFVYSVSFLCGEQRDDCHGCGPVRPGRYSTEINIHNPGAKQAAVLKRAIPLVLAGTVSGREPNLKAPTTLEVIRLPAHNATMDDCCHLVEILLGAPPAGPVPLTSGILEIISTTALSVTAVYTATSGDGGAPALEVVQIEQKVLII
jgi:hypothetical protein